VYFDKQSEKDNLKQNTDTCKHLKASLRRLNNTLQIFSGSYKQIYHPQSSAVSAVATMRLKQHHS